MIPMLDSRTWNRFASAKVSARTVSNRSHALIMVEVHLLACDPFLRLEATAEQLMMLKTTTL